MFAFPAAKRTLVLMMSIALLVSAFAVQAGQDSGYLGVVLQDLTPSMAKALQMGDQTGVMVSEVVDDSPADEAGLEDGDVILEFNGKSISDNGDLVKAVQKTSPGEKVKVVVLRSGKEQTLDVEVGQREKKNVFFMSGDDDVTWTMNNEVFVDLDTDRGYMGVHLEDLNEQMGDYFGVSDGEGALIKEVVEGSPAAEAGLKAGDVIVKLGDKDIDSSKTLYKVIEGTEPEQQMAVKVVRQGKDKSLSINLGEMPEDAIKKQIKIMSGGDDHYSIHTAPRMLKHYDHGNVDVHVIRSEDLDSDLEVLEIEALMEAREELDEMREELDKMRQDLKEMKEELKK